MKDLRKVVITFNFQAKMISKETIDFNDTEERADLLDSYNETDLLELREHLKKEFKDEMLGVYDDDDFEVISDVDVRVNFPVISSKEEIILNRNYDDPPYKMLSNHIMETCPNSRERSLALTKLEECMFWAEKAIERNEV